MTQNTKAWLHGLGAAAIGGGASAAAGGISISTLAPGAFSVGKTLELMAGTFLVSAVMGVLLFLKQSPLPAGTVEVTQQTTKTSTVTVTPTDGK